MRHMLFFVVSCSAVVVANAAELPFRVATSSESSSLTGSSVIATPLDQTPFNTAATVTAKKITGTGVTDTQRANQALSKVYKQSLEAGEDPGAQAVPPAVAPEEFLYYEHNLNSAQAWATMSERGAPFVQVYADGKSQGKAAASWRTRYTVQGTGNRDVYAKFTIPGVRFGGRWEDAAPSLTRGKMRIDLLVNGFPAWFTEAVRWNEKNPINYDTVRVDTFGNDIGLEGNSLGSNNHILTNASRVVTVKLGTYTAGENINLTMLYQVEGKGDGECKPSGGEMDCGNISMRVDWDPNAPQPTFYSKPAT
jgi:hypothetical protein